MEFTFAEILLALAAGYLLYRFLRPIQRRLERLLLGAFGGSKGSKKRGESKPVIDITQKR